MSRARVLGTLLVLVLLACAAVVYLDQRGAFGGTAGRGTNTSSGTSSGVSTTDSSTSGGSGYGDLK